MSLLPACARLCGRRDSGRGTACGNVSSNRCILRQSGGLPEAIGSGSSGRHIRVRRAVVIGEVALSLVLVSGALLLLRSLLNLQQIVTGVRIDNVITMSADLPANAYRSPREAALFYRAVAARIPPRPESRMSEFPLTYPSSGLEMVKRSCLAA